MRIVCPACAAAYDVPDDRLAVGRVVRCARCETDWVPLPGDEKPETAPEPEPVPELAPELPPELPHEPDPAPVSEPVVIAEPASAIGVAPSGGLPSRRGGWALGLAWVASVAVVLTALAGAVMGQERIMQAWPPSIRAYQALGLVHPPGHPPGDAQVSR